MENISLINEFHLLTFYSKSDYRLLSIFVFFFLYVFGVLINSIIITVICIDDQLHTPMYLFLCNLAIVDICYTTTTVPNLLYMLLAGDNSVSVIQCFTQMYFHALVATTEDLIILIMAYDRYVAICHPLHYHSILNRKHCLLYVFGSWISGFINSFVFLIPVSHMSFCHSQTIHQFLCDAKALFNISCPGSENFYIVLALELVTFGFLQLILSVTSYTKIIKVILQIKSTDGRKKAFSTCSSHLTVILMYYVTGLTVYMMPPFEFLLALEEVFTGLYSVVTPMINPLIYSLRNKDVKGALLKLMGVNSVIKIKE